MKPWKASRNRIAALCLLLVAGAPVILYWPFIPLPLFYDDLLHIRIVKSLDLVSVWLPTDAFSFYRPLTFVPLLLIKGAFGYYPNALMHGLSVGFHAANALLLAALAWRLWGRWTRAVASGLLFGFFPLTYQTIGNSSPNAHITMTLFLLLGLHAYLSFVERGGRRWAIAAGFCFLFALLSHEAAVLLGVFAALVHLNKESGWFRLSAVLSRRICLRGWLKSNSWTVLVALGGLYVLIHRQLPLAPPPQNGDSPYQWSEGVLYVMQAVIFPLAWFHHKGLYGRWLPDGAGEAIVLATLAGVLLATGLIVVRQRSSLAALLLGWGWWGLAALLLVLSLPPSYLLHGARLLYLSSVGVALLWAVWLDAIYRTPRVGKVAGALALCFILVTNGIFVRARLDHYAQMARPVIFAREFMADRPADEGIVFVNLPEWLNPDENTYPMGIEFVTLMGGYLFVEELVWENFPRPHPSLATHWHEPTGVLGYGYGFHGQTRVEDVVSDWAPAGSQVFVTNVTPGQVVVRHAGGVRRPEGAAEPLARFGPVEVLAARAELCAATVETMLQLHWQEERLPTAVALVLEVMDSVGEVVAEAEDLPLGLPMDRIKLRPGWQLVDRRNISVPADAGVQLALSVREPDAGMLYPAEDNQGRHLPGDRIDVPIADCRQ